MKRILTIYFGLLFMIDQPVSSQVISFSHLNTSNGLTENNARCLAIDKNGFLWIGTTNGLNSYDGYDVTAYYKTQHSALPSDTIEHILCDSHNRLWILTPHGAAWSQQGRNFTRVKLPAEGDNFTPYNILETTGYGVILFTSKGHFYFNEKRSEWEKVEWLSKLISSKEFNTARSFNRDAGIYVFEHKVIVIDYRQKKILFEKTIPNAVTASAFSNQSMAVATRHGWIGIFDIARNLELKNYQLDDQLEGQKTGIAVSEMYKASNGSLVMATGQAGLIIIDSVSGSISQYLHDPIDPGSVSTNLLYRVITGNSGEIITCSSSSGVSICNINNRQASYKRIFKDEKGNVFDGHLSGIEEDKGHSLWLAGVDRLVRWDPITNKSSFYQYYINTERGFRNLEIRTLCIDKKDRIWVGTIGAGVLLFNRQSGTFQAITKDTSLGKAVRSTYINDLMEDSEGAIWACTYGGFYTIDPGSHRIRVYDDHPLLKEPAGKVVISLFEDDRKRIWIGTQRYGVYCYDRQLQKVINYTTANGLLDNTGYSIVGDKNGNIYVAAPIGFSVIAADGTIRRYSRENGMRYNRCESILPDDEGNVWITNTKCLVKFSPTHNRLEYYEENAGISTDGFRYTAAGKTRDGHLYWGTHHGINYFDPLLIKNHTSQLHVTIYQALLPDSLLRFDNSPRLKVPYNDNSIQFHFSAINLNGSRNIAYQYLLEGFDKNWQSGTDIRQARYSSLPAGHYTFKVKASIDRINWTESNNQVLIDIVPPFWKKAWFIGAAVLLLTGLVITIFRFRINRIRYKERLKTIYNKKLSETEMKALRAQMNPHFIFNCLNSINKYILKNDHVTASRYLTRFAKLIRLILDNSNSREVTLSNELEALELYIDMESLRFANKFFYDIQIGEAVMPDSIQVPPLIIQPYVENAIWHGLLHKKAGAHLSIRINKPTENMLECIIEDNGIGRNKARELKSKSATTKKSLGMKLTEERISMLNQYAMFNASIDIVDLEDELGEATGTKVILKIPV